MRPAYQVSFTKIGKAWKPSLGANGRGAGGTLSVPIEPEIASIVNAYIAHKIMPNNGLGDALHLAVASYFECDFLFTWNCKHLANANKFQHIERVNGILHLFVPKLITPLELLGENYE